MLKHYLAAAGLLVELVGVLMFFRWVPIMPSFEREGRGIPETPEDEAARGEAHRRHTRYATLALALVAVGLILQLLDVVFVD